MVVVYIDKIFDLQNPFNQFFLHFLNAGELANLITQLLS